MPPPFDSSQLREILQALRGDLDAILGHADGVLALTEVAGLAEQGVLEVGGGLVTIAGLGFHGLFDHTSQPLRDVFVAFANRG